MLLYHLYRHKNITPGDFYRMPPGERLLLTAFCQQELEDWRDAQSERRMR